MNLKINKKILVVVVALVIGIVAATALLTFTGTEEKEPTEVVEAYIEAMAQGNITEAKQYTTGQKKQYFENLTQQHRENFKEAMEGTEITVEILEENIEQDKATIELNLTERLIEQDVEDTVGRIYHLIKKGEAWRIQKINKRE